MLRCTGPARVNAHLKPAELLQKAAMPHFLDWFVPVYLMISILILVGFGACIYYFEPGLQEAHKWRTQRPIMERDLRKTLMIRDNLAFGVPEV
ncbi:long intergenic non-protein coding RNA 634 isoform X1 [Gallus gallus]|uniref:long intergenic non-protein coding RNA 634 isoform X1 n=1 Tax=Gallus gallus TaxID=9031 RepID=UPI001F0202AC|nr:long intergenic non-protein coding RNA 634 isoform X1 [Gallus gallus]XP_046762194.1 long intergenic non-protein coding RNA 634 isoform X1 [Gallus gallus]